MSSAFYIFKEFLILSFYLVIDLSDLSRLGGFQYISALKKAFPHVSMVASQGIKIGTRYKWFRIIMLDITLPA